MGSYMQTKSFVCITMWCININVLEIISLQLLYIAFVLCNMCQTQP